MRSRVTVVMSFVVSGGVIEGLLGHTEQARHDLPTMINREVPEELRAPRRACVPAREADTVNDAIRVFNGPSEIWFVLHGSGVEKKRARSM
jgi:hypothetical protein